MVMYLSFGGRERKKNVRSIDIAFETNGSQCRLLLDDSVVLFLCSEQYMIYDRINFSLSNDFKIFINVIVEENTTRLSANLQIRMMEISLF